MSTSLQSLLDNPDTPINVMVQISSANRSTGSSGTWFFSRFASDILTDLFWPYLRGIGPLTKSLSEDVQFGQLADTSPGSIVLIQEVPAVDRLSLMMDYTFEGYTAIVKIGELGVDSFANSYTIYTATIDAEPIIELVEEGVRVTINLSSIISRMAKEPISLSRYLGIQTCLRHQTTTGVATAAHIAAYDLTRFTCIFLFRKVVAGNPTSAVYLLNKLTTDANCNWSVRLLNTGVVDFNASSGGVANSLSCSSSPSTYADGLWHTVVVSRDNITTSYLMIDNTVKSRDTVLGAVDLATTATIRFGLLLNSADDVEICMVALFDRYIPEDEGRILSAIRLEGTETGCIGLWRCDDNTGGTANDYSSSNNDATVAGVVNTDYAWKPSYLGVPELTGRPYPLTLGIPFNAPTHLIDVSRQIHKINSSNVETNNRTVNLKSRGTALVQTTDYADNADGTFTMVAAEDEPVTFDVTQSPRNYLNTAPRIIYDLWELLGTTGEDGYEQMIALSNLLPGSIGYYSQESPDYGEVAKMLLGGMGAYYRESPSGYPVSDFLLPPIDLSPYDTACIDFGGHPQSINFGNKANITSSHTICAWFKTFAIDQSADSSTPGIYQVIVLKPDAYLIYYYMAGTNNGKVVVSLGSGTPTSVTSPVRLITDGTWYFIAHVYDDAANTMTLYIAAEGQSLVQVAQTTGATPTIGTGFDLSTGFTTWGSVHGIHIWNTTKTLVQLQALMTTPPVGNESNLIFYAPMSEGSGTLTYDKVSGSSATQGFYNKWSPLLTIDLNSTPSVKLTEFRHVAPAWKIVVKYARNWLPMSSADIDTGVSQSNRIDLRRQWKEVPWINSENRTRFKRAKEIIFESCLTEQTFAQRLLRMMVTRFGTDRYVAMLDLPPGQLISRRAASLELGDEVRLISAIPSQLASGRSMRVVARTLNPIDLSCRIGLWG